MGHGGKRPNSGRKPGKANKTSTVAAVKVAETGATPLDIILGSARKLYEQGDFAAASAAAHRAAPYVHQKFAVTQEPAVRHPEQKTQGDLFDRVPVVPAPVVEHDGWDGILN